MGGPEGGIRIVRLETRNEGRKKRKGHTKTIFLTSRRSSSFFGRFREKGYLHQMGGREGCMYIPLTSHTRIQNRHQLAIAVYIGASRNSNSHSNSDPYSTCIPNKQQKPHQHQSYPRSLSPRRAEILSTLPLQSLTSNPRSCVYHATRSSASIKSWSGIPLSKMKVERAETISLRRYPGRGGEGREMGYMRSKWFVDGREKDQRRVYR